MHKFLLLIVGIFLTVACVDQNEVAVIEGWEVTNAQCSDGKDNDKDGLIDCDDDKCLNTHVCAGVEPPPDSEEEETDSVVEIDSESESDELDTEFEDADTEVGKVDSIVWVTMLGGEYSMGSTRNENESPVHQVTIPEFKITKTEITSSQYLACVNAGVCDEIDGNILSNNFKLPNRENQPANYIGIVHARIYCEWIDGRLPSESEWEYAAKGSGYDRVYPWGSSLAHCDYSVMYTSLAGCGTTETFNVCSKGKGNTVQRLCDMSGNVAEWVEDTYMANYDGVPTDGRPYKSESLGNLYVLRGGAYIDKAEFLTTTFRGTASGSFADRHTGFRCAKDSI